MQALILAAGAGSRLDGLGMNVPKCLTMVAGISILERSINNLLKVGVTTIYITVKYKADDIIEYINNHYSSDVDIKFIDERQFPDFPRNNIYSFMISLPQLNTDDDLFLLEGDIIFDSSILSNLLSSKGNKVVLSSYAKYLNGNGIIVDGDKCVGLCPYTNKTNLYKTVNIYYIASQYLRQLNEKDIDEFVKSHNYNYNYYYEESFDWSQFTPIIVSPTQWYEIDTPADYYAANIIYSSGKEKYNLLCQRYGGHWRLPGLIDCCYLTNPFFKPQKIIKSIGEQLDTLITAYPAGDLECRRSAADLLSIKDYNRVLVGNGASELINVLGRYFYNKNTYTSIPAFNEYLENFNNIQFNDLEEADICIIINPNNPMGTYMDYSEISLLINLYPEITFIIDESFNDFVDKDIRESFIGCEYKNVIVVKSLGKTYGVNGLKLGVLYSANTDFIKGLKDLMPSWNINSIAQEFLAQIKYYTQEYLDACTKLASERARVTKKLREEISDIVVIESQTDFITIQLPNIDANQLCISMLDRYNIFIKNLNNKIGLESQNYVRLALNDIEINDYVIKCLKECIKDV